MLLADLSISVVRTPIHIVLDSSEVRSFIVYEHLEDIHVHVLSAEEAAKQDALSGYQRTMKTYARALALSSKEGVLLSEDDLTFGEDWFSKTNRMIDELKLQYKHFGLWLYDYANLEQAHSLAYFKHHPDTWIYGPVCAYFPQGVALELAEKLLENQTTPCEVWNDGRRRDWAPDAYASWWLKEMGYPRFVCTPSLVQHFGDEGQSGVAGMRTKTFRG